MRGFFLPAMAVGFVLTIAAVPAAGQAPQVPAQQLKSPPEKVVTPILPPELRTQFAGALGTCNAFAKSSFSVSGTWHGSAGGDSVVPYTTVVTNVGQNWQVPVTSFPPNPGNYYMAPCDGQYFFAISFVRDSVYNCGGAVGTRDDVNVYLVRYPSQSSTSIIINPIGAWAGESLNAPRATGAYSVLPQLNTGDAIVSYVHSDGGPHRCLASYQLTGFRVAP
jgi:hypothetical protein